MFNFLSQRLGAFAGVISPILAFSCIIVAILTYPDFSWTNNALSDLGIISGLTASVFNFGLFAGGLLAFNFSVFGLLAYFRRNVIGQIGSLVFAAATIALMAIGIFNENFKPTHYIVSVGFFTLAPIALLFLVGGFYLCKDRKMMVFTIFVAAIAAVVWIVQLLLHSFPNVAIPEFVSGLALSVWSVKMSKKIFESSSVHF
jgi:hypothetical membrane protein